MNELLKENRNVTFSADLHLSVNLRSFRAEKLSTFVHMLLSFDRQAQNVYREFCDKYPIVLTRNMNTARKWLRDRAMGTERTGILVTKEAARFKPLAVHILPSGDENAVHWFLEDKTDTRSSNYLEDAATEIQVQGLELDYDINISNNTTQMSELYMRKQTDFTEKKIFPYLTIDDLDMSLMKRVRNLAKSKDANHPWIGLDDMGIFRSAGLYERDFTTGQEGFNLAAVLLFGKDETIQSCLPAYRTDAIFREVNVDRYDDRDDVRTNLIDSYDRLTEFICRHIDDKFFLEGTQRISVRSIIAREIVSNILMHREYSSPYPAKIVIEKGRILTENANKTYHYGRILATSTPYPKNPVIAKFFNNIGRADELGSGVRNLYKYTKMYSDGEPVLFEDDVFKVEIPLLGIDTADKPPINRR